MTPSKLLDIKNKLFQIDWIGHLNSESCTTNFDTYSNILKGVMDKVAPLKTVRISAKHRFKELWMSRSIETSSRKCIDLYKATLKKDATPEAYDKYIKYRNSYNRLKRMAKMNYYKQQVEESN